MAVNDYVTVFIGVLLLVISQVCLKLWLMEGNFDVWPPNLILLRGMVSVKFLTSLLSMAVGGVLWLGLLKKIQFSILYPMVSLSYVVGLIAAVLVFKETVPLVRWIGVALIMSGVCLIGRS
jgi:drug/metabolite transporter (DMT)-like permease